MPSDLKNVHVALSERSYDIEIGAGNLAEIGRLTTDCTRVTHAIVMTDANVERPHAQIVGESLAATGAEVDLVVVEPGEPSKSVDSAFQLWNQMLELGADRKSVVVAAGGGVVGDLAGFIAATYGRGVSFVQAPTSLLAQVDSSVGGKVGINLPGAKNMVGAFWQPLAVLIDVDTLKTLPDREYRSGLAEVVKYGVILDADFFAYLEAHVAELNARDPEVLIEIVTKSCRLKADVVEADERETLGLRAVLNYGHTFAHAFESSCGYGELLHGEAVSIGMLCASRLAERLGRIDVEATRRQLDLLTALQLPVDVPDADRRELLAIMRRDKKVEHGRLRYILPSKIGAVQLVDDVDPEDAMAALRDSE
jgi:3-dehydroquinate synthase